MSVYKILITGTMGAGKTTAIAAVSEIPPVLTDVQNTDTDIRKPKTTVGLDYGEVTLTNGEKLCLYGTPGQSRFDFMWDILAQGALGILILIDNSRTAPLEDLDVYLRGFKRLITEVGCVVAVGRTESHPFPDLDAYSARLAEHDLICPILTADVRHHSDVLMLLDVLLIQVEAKILPEYEVE